MDQIPNFCSFNTRFHSSVLFRCETYLQDKILKKSSRFTNLLEFILNVEKNVKKVAWYNSELNNKIK